VRGPPLRGRAGAHHAAAAGQEPPPWERWRRRLEINKRWQQRSIVVVGSSARAEAAAVDVVLRRPLQLQASQLEMQVRPGLADKAAPAASWACMDRSERVLSCNVMMHDLALSIDPDACIVDIEEVACYVFVALSIACLSDLLVTY
jgi:hypothetical protein